MPKVVKGEEASLAFEFSEPGVSDAPKSTPATPRVTKASIATTAMTEMDLNTLFKFIKPYDGSRETVNSFIINCNNAYELASESQRQILFKYIISQLQGKAEIACSIKEFKDWEQLKDFLKTQFSERKHYAHILTELQESKQNPHDSVNQFALRIETCLSQLLTEISLCNTKAKELPGRVAAMEDLALHHFLMGLHPRISNIVRCRSPKTLNEAINLAISEERIQQSLYKRPPPETRYEQKPKQNFIKSFNSKPTIPQKYSQYPNMNQQSSPNAFCRYCKTAGHDIMACKKREYANNRFRVSSRCRPRLNPKAGTNHSFLISKDHKGNQPQTRVHQSKDHTGNQPQASVHQSKDHMGNQPQARVQYPKDHTGNEPQASVHQSKDHMGNQPQASVQYPKDHKGNQPQASVQPSKTHNSKTPSPTSKIKIYEINLDTTKRLLPHILLDSSVTDIPLSLLVDSGSAICLLKQSSIQGNLKLIKEPIKLKGIDPGDEPTTTEGHFPLKLKLNKTISASHKFHVIKNINLPYDGIIGSDFLTAFGCKIDYTNDTLKIGKLEIKLHFVDPFYIIPPRTETVIECSVCDTDLKEGLITDQHISENLLISNCIVKIKENKRVNLTIANTSEFPVNLNPNLNLKIAPLHSDAVQVNTNHSNTINRTNDVINSLRTDHLNQEESNALIELCSQYSDIFHLPDDKLTYTSALSHQIKTNSETPIHT
ncbi:unnamed protein product [Parnassius apollo]|uniref:(apollo) hypothetical protein n=1 Tax=Parnassius apollo TaxID=110799 RepID=A0A8S3WVC4_PARAO|nr:unnamed protein product [Parnassius apollo]